MLKILQKEKKRHSKSKLFNERINFTVVTPGFEGFFTTTIAFKLFSAVLLNI